jgi:hypothetical protein
MELRRTEVGMERTQWASLALRLSKAVQQPVTWSRADWRASTPAEAASSAADRESMCLQAVGGSAKRGGGEQKQVSV